MSFINLLTNMQEKDKEIRSNRWGLRMNKMELLMAKHQYLDYVFTENMPYRLAGYCSNEVVFINLTRNKTIAEKLVTLAEETGHYMTGAGNIREQKTVIDWKQENKARRWGNQYIVTLDELIHCWHKGYKSPYEIATELEVTEECVQDAIESYRITRGMSFQYKEYQIKFITDLNLEITKLSGEISSFTYNN